MKAFFFFASDIGFTQKGLDPHSKSPAKILKTALFALRSPRTARFPQERSATAGAKKPECRARANIGARSSREFRDYVEDGL